MNRVCRVLLFAALLALGCGSPVAGSISGKVTYNDAPVKGGRVTFYAIDGRGFPTSLHEDGSYTIDNVPPGAMKVCVDTSYLDPKKGKAHTYSPPPGMKKDLPEGGGSGGGDTFTALPAKYADPKTTDLTHDVKGGSQTFDLKLK